MIKKTSILVYILLGCLALGAFTSCSTKKKRKKKDDPSAIGKVYHNLTAHYNGYFNANELLKTSYANLNAQYRDNYNQVLPLYKHSAVDNAQSEFASLDEVIKKSSVGIQLHRTSRWSDDSYMLIGEARYLKQEYDEAEKTFNFIIDEYDPNSKRNKKKRKKKKKKKSKKKAEENPKTKFPLQHRPIRYDAQVWLARTLVEQGRFDEAETIVLRLQKDEGLHKTLKDELASTEAYIQLERKSYTNAIEPLQRAIEIAKRKKDKSRMTYILGQLYEREGMYAEASDAFKKVLKLRPDYDMEFATRLRAAQTELANGGDVDAVRKKLRRMSRDAKNVEYRDQVFFALAQLELDNGNRQDGIDNLLKSVAASTDNQAQKAESYLMLAGLYFEDELYVKSKNYYDSTLTVLAKNDDRYEQTKQYSENLTGIAKNLSTIQLQDSLLMIAEMNPAQQKRLVAQLKKREAEQVAAKAANVKTPSRPTAPSTLKSDFWVYDSRQAKKASKDFIKTWGDLRKREDNWRRSAAKSTGDFDDDPELADLPTVSEDDEARFLRNVPKTDADKKKAHAQIEEAYSNLGNLYRDKINNTPKSIEAYEQLLKRYPGGKYEADALYSLFIAYDEQGKTALADSYKMKLIEKYPSSRYARAVIDPDFKNQAEQQANAVLNHYENALKNYENGNYAQSLQAAMVADSIFGSKNTIKPKFALLAALSTGGVKGKDAYIASLRGVMTTYPKTDEADEAQRIIAYLTGEKVPKKPSATPEKPGDKPKPSAPEGTFKEEKDKKHYILIAIKDVTAKRGPIKVAISNYNRSNHSLDRLKVSSLSLDLKTPIMVIRSYPNAEKAAKFVAGTQGKESELTGTSVPVKVMSISQNNYKALLRFKNLDEYTTYYDENY